MSETCQLLDKTEIEKRKNYIKEIIDEYAYKNSIYSNDRELKRLISNIEEYIRKFKDETKSLRSMYINSILFYTDDDKKFQENIDKSLKDIFMNFTQNIDVETIINKCIGSDSILDKKKFVDVKEAMEFIKITYSEYYHNRRKNNNYVLSLIKSDKNFEHISELEAKLVTVKELYEKLKYAGDILSATIKIAEVLVKENNITPAIYKDLKENVEKYEYIFYTEIDI